MDNEKGLDFHKLRRNILGDKFDRGDLVPGTAVSELSKDTLTGLLPRALWESQMKQFYEYARRSGTHFAIAMMDIDNFGDYNNTYGHLAGDQKLKEFGQGIQKRFREADIKGRYGGDEMIVMLTDFSLDDNQLEQEEEKLVQDLKKACGVDISLGIAKWKGQKTLKELIKKADQRLYLVKNQKKHD